MKLEAIGRAFIYRWPGGEVRLEPGKPIELPPERGAKLLARAQGRVRQIGPPDPPVIEPARRLDEQPMALVYFERNDGRIYGPATVLDFMSANAGGSKRDWVVVEHGGFWEFVLGERLRTRKQFETQKPLREVELIREIR